ncbi:hypothetical protein RSSM_04258 [Rhodopirellula sallentina SM41]|uniref:Uncharacterized protein n=1 Tax=Rhodopirellula sallentina SM41 TaxID=1263870 RepID=M5TYI1_9BACT|nr:hypothetical protein RSSM_04258 [Rhodopirellula sallentina SM41]
MAEPAGEAARNASVDRTPGLRRNDRAVLDKAGLSARATHPRVARFGCNRLRRN